MTKGMNFPDFEELRSQALSFLDQINDENMRNRLIQIMINFKNAINETKKQMEYMGE